MKVSAAIAFSATVSVALFESAMGMSTYLTYIPNGDSFAQALGHPDNDSSQYTDFATAFLAAGLTWNSDFCSASFATSDTTIDMTNGEAFGDPCCTWTSGGTPDFTVTAFTISPTEKTVCASSSTTSSAASTTASSAASTTASSAASTTASSAASTTASSAASATTEESTTASSAASTTEEYSTASSAASASTTEETTESASAETETTTAPATTTASPTVSKCNVRRN